MSQTTPFIDCDQADELIGKIITESITPEESAKLLNHTKTCETCKKKMKELLAIDELLTFDEALTEIDPEYREKLKQDLIKKYTEKVEMEETKEEK